MEVRHPLVRYTRGDRFDDVKSSLQRTAHTVRNMFYATEQHRPLLKSFFEVVVNKFRELSLYIGTCCPVTFGNSWDV